MGRSAPPSSRSFHSGRSASAGGRVTETAQRSLWDDDADDSREGRALRERDDAFDDAFDDEQPEPTLHNVELDEARIDPDAVKVVQRLTRHGFEGYLVGGCVRDLLVGMRPKDFDVATSARPEDIRKLFRNSRIIGRRFRLVHILFGAGKVIETATFRSAPRQSEQGGPTLLIRSDNAFGEAHEDAQRRDFTINGLFYDVEAKQVLDWIGGMPDIEARTVRTIGDPIVRFFEDPVRILRAIKFSARLDLGIAPEVYDAIVFCRGSLSQAAKPRLFEELLRLMRSAAAHRALWLCWETGVLDVLLPELSAYLSDADDGTAWRMLSAVDKRVARGGPPLDDAVLWTVLLLGPLNEACQGARDRVNAALDFLEPLVDRLNMPRRIADAVRRIVGVLPKLEAGRGGRVARSGLYELAQQVQDIRQEAMDVQRAQPEAEEAPPKKRTARRRSRKKSAVPAA
ncbi:MAG: polynucleotide adenylyltransferase PcnB [Polyangiaceae bacterium]|nr:polynucleotide adenylyltransferase PcnB [Polyangiaceae bacterium]